MRGRIRYQKPSQYWHPWTSWPPKMSREEACEWLAERLEEFWPKFEEARERYHELEDEIEFTREREKELCKEDTGTHGCRIVRRKLEHLYDEQEKASHDIGKYQSRIINIEQRMKYLKCEEIL